jgi:flagellin
MTLSFGGSGFATPRSVVHMGQAKSLMDKSLLKLSSGKRLLDGKDDPGGLAVATKLKNNAAINNTAINRVDNAKSLLEMQYDTLIHASSVISEMETIQDTFNSEGGRGGPNVSTLEDKFSDLYNLLRYNLGTQGIAGSGIFYRADMTVQTTTNSSSGLILDGIHYEGIILPNSGLNQKGVSGIDSSDSDLSAALTRVTSEISRIGSDLSSLEFASAYLSEVSTDLEVAYGRIMDVDIAEESANLAKYSMQYEAAAAAVAQANVAMSAALDLLLGSINQK